MPFPGTRVIPADWSAHHAPVAVGGMNATVTCGVQTGTRYDPDLDDTVATWSTDYDGPARVQALNDAGQYPAAGQQIAGRAYLVQLQFAAADVIPGARVKVTACRNDAQLAGQDLWVVDVQLGSERFTRDLICSDNQTDAPTAAV